MNPHYQSLFAPRLFAGQAVVITGGDSDIGRCAAHEQTHRDAHVVLVGHTQDKLASVRAEIEADGGGASTHACDIRSEAEVSAAIAFLLSPASSFAHGSVLHMDGARPQLRTGRALPTPAAGHATVQPSPRFHRAATPRLFAKAPEGQA